MKKTTQPEFSCCILQSFPTKFFDSTYRFVPLYGKFCEIRQKQFTQVQKGFVRLLLLYGEIATVLVRPSADVLARLILLEVFFKNSQYMLTLFIAVWPLEDDTFEKNLVFVKFDVP